MGYLTDCSAQPGEPRVTRHALYSAEMLKWFGQRPGRKRPAIWVDRVKLNSLHISRLRALSLYISLSLSLSLSLSTSLFISPSPYLALSLSSSLSPFLSLHLSLSVSLSLSLSLSLSPN